ncbi:conserved Plasmodium protein, unknown function [Plasmodium gallinaceum]|uniref:Uncharacterized protein n=1 Tax=Plasmodium gallinaceum TaxID=5849 RepID=A0A1J1GZK8_PLAGA|nr:conserved Plasmodium protein, unknown function [Plasmodium gallinaceum]CRG96459.1 conserved Plasmodium protein, unknown function [Plasmodium gallinaceum]
MIKKILKNLSISIENKDDNFSHIENILNLIEAIIIHENSYWKYVNILNELTSLCYEDPVNFRKLLFIKKEKLDEQKKKVDQIIDRILIVLEKYEDSRNTFIYSITKLVLINDFNLNINILSILCNLVMNEEYKYYIYAAFEEIIVSIILNSAEIETLENIFQGLYHLPKDKFIAGCFNSCMHKVIQQLRNSFNEHILGFLSVLTLEKENCLIAYDEGLLKILTEEIDKYKNYDFDDIPNYFKDIYMIISQLCSNYFKHCDILIRDKMHLDFFFKKIKEIINVSKIEISKKKSFFCNIIIFTLNNICKYNDTTLFELCNTFHFIDLLLICIKMELGNPYLLSASLGGLLVVLKNQEIYKSNIEYILDNTHNLKILLPFLFGQKYNNIYNFYYNSDNEIELYLLDIIKYTLDIIGFFFLKEVDKFTIKVKKEFRNSNINYFLLKCFEKKNEDIIIRMLKCIYLIPFNDYKHIELHKIFFILHEKNIIVNDKWKEIYYYCIKIYIKVLRNEEVKRIIEYYNFKNTIISVLRIMNQFLSRINGLQKKSEYLLSKKRIGEENDNIFDQEEKIDLNKISVELLSISSRYIDLRPFMRNNSITYYFLEILSNEDSLFSELTIDYDILVEKTWCGNIENIFKTLMKQNIKKNKKVCLRLLINIADIFSGYFYLFKSSANTNIFKICNREEKQWNKKKILEYFFLMSDNDRLDYKDQVYIFLKHYMGNLFSLLDIFIHNNIFTGLKKDLEENYFPGILKYNKLRYEKKICNLKLKEKEIKEKIERIKIDKNISQYKRLNEELQNVNNKKRKLFFKLDSNNFMQTFDLFIDNEISNNIEFMFDLPKVVKKKKTIKYLKTNYTKKTIDDKNVLKKKMDSFDEVNLDVNEKKNVNIDTIDNLNNKEIENNENSIRNNLSIEDEEKKDIKKNIENSLDDSYSYSGDSSSSSLAEENPNETVLDKISSYLLSFDKEIVYEQKFNNFNILLFNKRGVFINSSRGEVNEAYILYAALRIFYSLIINNINNENYFQLKEYLLRINVIKTLINFLNQCSFYDCNVFAHFLRLYSEILKKNLTSVESMNMLIFYNIFFYYCKIMSREFIKKIINSEYIISYKEQYFFAELSQLFYYFTQKIIYIHFSQYSEIQKWCVDCSLFHFFYKNNILLLLYLFIYIHNVHYGSVYASYIYHKKNFHFIHTIFFYTLFSLSYLMCFSKKLKYFILYFINYKRYINKILFRKSIIHSLFFYYKLIFIRIVFQNQLSLEKKSPKQIYHISPVIYIRKNSIEWYFLALGLDKFYLVYIPDNFEEDITEDKDIKLIIHSEKKYVDITRICVSKINDNFFVFGYINFENNASYETYDIFISLNKYFRDEIISYAQFLSGSDYETRVDLLQDNIIPNNLKNYMNIKNIIMTSFAYKEITPSDQLKKEMKEKEKEKRKKEDEDYEESYESNIFSEYSGSLNVSSENEKSDKSDKSDSQSDDDFNIFRRNKNKNKRKLLFFVLTKNHLYVFKFNFKHWIFLSPFIDEEKDDILLYVESSLDSEGKKRKLFTNNKIYLKNFLGITADITHSGDVSFVRKCAIRNTIKHIYQSSNTECTNDQVVSTSFTTTNTTNLSDEQKKNEITRNKEKFTEKKRYEYANKFLLKIVHKYNNEYLNRIKFLNNIESIISLNYKVKQNERTIKKKIKMVLFDDYTRELWKRSIAQSLNILMTSSEWKRKWN